LSLLFIVISFLSLLAYKVYKNVGLSVDEIESKIEDGLIEITNLNHEIENTQKEVVFTMGSIGESRSKETGNHVKRVAEYSKLLALYYGLDEKEAELLKQASPMHDIGKVAIPDSILNKPGRFNDSERKIMDTHATFGYEMLKHSDRALLKTAAIVAYEHHEKWDGTGYPRGLSGENIHIYGRITALADVFDALGSDRCYKKAWDDEKIFNLFKEERAKHFDPRLIDIFFEHLDEFLKIRDSLKDKF
jgi:response regulator RpfG family c-di-GMP phosphodiesterase